MNESATNTKEALLSEFRSNFDRLVFPQPLVADVIGAAQQDLNTWRSRELIKLGVQKDTRVAYTGRGLIHAGIINELAVFMDPKRAAYFSAELINTVDGFRDDLFATNLIEFHRSYGHDGNPAAHGRELFMSIAPEAMVFELDRNRAQLLMPLRDLMKRWAIASQIKLKPSK